MSLWAIIPAKDPWLAKSRLAGVLSPTRRWSLSMQLLDQTLRATSAARLVDRCLVISSAAPQLALARDFGAVAVHELHTPRITASQTSNVWHAEALSAKAAGAPLNAALRQAAEVAIRGGAAALLILPSDLLLISAEAIDGMVRALPEGPGLVLAPDRHLSGTNALLMRPPMVIPFLFGPESFDAHQRLAGALHVPLVVHESLALAGDLDTPDDLAYLGQSALLSGDWREPRVRSAAAATGGRPAHRSAVPARSSSAL